jgi:23S rRNA pseudouridine1911/1915/1917 synthase
MDSKMEIKIIAETPEYVVIDKPAGIPAHGDGRKERYTVADWVAEKYPDVLGVGDDARVEVSGEVIIVPRPGIVHRLDADTSGVMIVAKTPDMYRHLKQQFHDRLVTKSYTAVVHGQFRQMRGTINAAIGDARGGVQVKAVGARARGELREAITTFRVVKACRDQFDRSMSIIECVPKTGRTHQIRVHMKYDGHPLVSDSLYCPRPLLQDDAKLIGRLALHAGRLTFADNKGVSHTFEAPMPPDMVELVKSLENQ